jgi:hypothetical protein
MPIPTQNVQDEIGGFESSARWVCSDSALHHSLVTTDVRIIRRPMV